MIEPAYRYRTELLRVIDGDTYVMRIDLGFRVRVDLEIRLHAWSCPELSTPEGKVARTEAFKILSSASVIVIESYRDQRSFARWVADVYADGLALGPLLQEIGLAQPGARVG